METKRIFFSYAWRDMGLAMRIDADLRKAGLSTLWRDHIDGAPVENFRDEYRREIEACSYFIMLDSENYRKYAHWCRDELACFFKAKEADPSKKLVVCLAQPPGAWRNEELFPGQSFYKFIDFGVAGTSGCLYDNEGKYRVAAEALCAVFGVKYQPWIEKDFERDFLDELQTLSSLSEADRRCILNDYETIRHYRLLNHPTVESRIRNFIADCEALSVCSFFPYMLLGDYQSSEKDYAACYRTFGRLARKFPEEPRGHRWLAASAFYLGKYDEALEHYYRSIELSFLPAHRKQRQYLGKVVLDILCVYITRCEYATALSEAARFGPFPGECPAEGYRWYAYRSHCCLALGLDEQNRHILQEGLERFPDSAELYELAGHLAVRQRLFRQALAWYSQAVQRCITVRQYIGNYTAIAHVYSLTGAVDTPGFRQAYASVLDYAEAFAGELTAADWDDIADLYSYAGMVERSNECAAKAEVYRRRETNGMP